MKGLIVTAALVLSSTAVFADTPQKKLTEASEVFSEIMGTPDKGIPQDILDKAQCVVIVPGLKKAAFVVGGEFGSGVATCRTGTTAGGWSAPAFIKMEGGSFGAQIGASSTDVVMVVMNKRGMDKLLGDKFTLGADAAVAAGPVGRTANASTDVSMSAEILAWSRSKGLFAGLALKGATLRPDSDDNEAFYGHKMTNREILTSTMAVPPAAQPLINALGSQSMHKEGTSADRVKDKQ